MPFGRYNPPIFRCSFCLLPHLCLYRLLCETHDTRIPDDSGRWFNDAAPVHAAHDGRETRAPLDGPPPVHYFRSHLTLLYGLTNSVSYPDFFRRGVFLSDDKASLSYGSLIRPHRHRRSAMKSGVVRLILPLHSFVDMDAPYNDGNQ